jgi:hypothetical protein
MVGSAIRIGIQSVEVEAEAREQALPRAKAWVDGRF